MKNLFNNFLTLFNRFSIFLRGAANVFLQTKNITGAYKSAQLYIGTALTCSVLNSKLHKAYIETL